MRFRWCCPHGWVGEPILSAIKSIKIRTTPLPGSSQILFVAVCSGLTASIIV
jgi:hypothetical protein